MTANELDEMWARIQILKNALKIVRFAVDNVHDELLTASTIDNDWARQLCQASNDIYDALGEDRSHLVSLSKPRSKLHTLPTEGLLALLRGEATILPNEPTLEMLNEGHSAQFDNGGNPTSVVYGAMLAAGPWTKKEK